ncbi:ABC transporter permease [Variovorax sp. RCC_210]|uniref:ABC transporter permease n=1 Tax=Variovorax sp. RCC_210 TaxID=3239217 RepID=UPI0035261132
MGRTEHATRQTVRQAVRQTAQHAVGLGRAAWLAVYPLVLLALAWEFVARAGWVRPLFLPTFSDVLQALGAGLAGGDLLPALWASLYRAVLGIGIALAVGVPLGYLLARFKWLRWAFEPITALGFPMPKIALIPVVTLWFGIEDASKIVLVVVTCVFPFLLSAKAAAEQIPTKMLWAARSMGTSPLALIVRVVLPATLPSILTGLRIAFPIGLITVFTAEMVTGGGLGEVIVLAQRYFETSKVYACVLLTMAVGYAADSLIASAQHRWSR